MNQPPCPGDVVRAFLDCINALDLDGAAALCAPDFVWENMPMDPPANRIEGAGGMVHRLRAVLDHCERVEWSILEQAVDGDTVLNERMDAHWFKPGIFPRSSYLGAPVMGVWKVRDGLITLWRDYTELAEFEKQLGMSIPDFGRLIGRNYGQDGVPAAA
jgi:limonene-1,2-epoxide hydrolase